MNGERQKELPSLITEPTPPDGGWGWMVESEVEGGVYGREAG